MAWVTSLYYYKQENYGVNLNLCGGYGTKTLREHARKSSCHVGTRTDVVTTIQQDSSQTLSHLINVKLGVLVRQ